MGKLYYYYDPIVKSGELRYYINYYLTDGRKTISEGYIDGDTQIAALRKVKNVVHILNAPRPIFGHDGRLNRWFKWMKSIRNK